MQNSPEFDFNKILDQTLYTYLPETLPMPEDIQKSYIAEQKKTWSPALKYGFVKRLWPIVMLIGVVKIIVGVILLIFLLLLASDLDKMFGTENSKIISLMCFGGLIILVVSGMMLLTSLVLEKKRVMWFFILISTFLCVYIFLLSVIKIHFALLVLERDTYKIIDKSIPENRHILLSNACVEGIATMLGSVIHFIGNVTVFTYYNLKYIQPVLFSCGP